MIHQVLMFLAPDIAAAQGLTQATLRTPPAYPSQATSLRQPGSENHFLVKRLNIEKGLGRKWFSDPTVIVKFIASVLGNAVGLASFIAGCWLCLQLMGAFL